ncbi:MFS transporter [Streptomyces griseoaurantiacus]|uniref:MFS transporter n=1 Tax=Streptomyces griseoaurantiacus TaxID=68213 RepID=UPI00379F2119
MTTVPSAPTKQRARITVSHTSAAIMLICGATLLFEGYDVYVFGVAVPSLLQDSGWQLSPEYVGVIGSAAVFGMLVGAFAAGTFTDILGRRRVYLATVATFSLGMLLCAVAPNPEFLLVSRVIVGIGSGGFLPTALSVVVEFSPAGKKNFNVALALAGIGIGGILCALLGIWMLPVFGYRSLFWIGAIPLFTLLPLIMARMPESVAFLVSKGRIDQAREQVTRFRLPVTLDEVETGSAHQEDHRGSRALDATLALFGRAHIRATVVFWLSTSLCLLLLFGTNTWLPSLMMKAGYGINSALSFLVFLNIGAVVGSLIGSAVADRTGPKPVVLVGFAGAAVALCALALQPPTVLVYALVLLVGAGGAGTQNLINSYMATYYPPSSRGSGLGLALAFGRLGGIVGPIYGGFILASGASTATGFLAFTIPPALAICVVAFGPRVAGRVKERLA